MSSNSEMGCSPSQFDAASVPTSKAAQAEAQDRDTEDAASHVETAVAGMDAPGEAGDEFDFFEDRDKFPPREDHFETKAPSTLRTASVPAIAANKQAKQEAFLGRAFSAPATYTPLDAEDMRMQAVRGIHMNLYLRRKSSAGLDTEGNAAVRVPSVPLEGGMDEQQQSETVKMMHALLRELPHRSDGAAALQHLETACKELGMERGRRSSMSLIPQDTIQETESEDEEEELSLEGIIQDIEQTC
mmetsp:Transcript_50271/g.100278  ORF Transcript_50271/g.100278 Transcript_50271/m.100278 type:complete len:244 (+) Transcript_50271:113-844(+)